MIDRTAEDIAQDRRISALEALAQIHEDRIRIFEAEVKRLSALDKLADEVAALKELFSGIGGRGRKP